MKRKSPMRRLAEGALVAAVAALLSGCLLWPGQFSATLDLRRDGTFTYTYDGEIYLMALSKLAQMGSGMQADETFEPEPCFDDDSFEERDCTGDELAAQRRTWDESQAERAERKKREADAARAMLGGLDPADPAAAEELAARLRRQAGWKEVTSKGDGRFDVRFALTGKIEHDFLFPTIEGFPMVNSFVAVTRRVDGTIRVDAPGFAPQASGNPFQSLIAGMGGMPLPAGDGNETGPAIPRTEGTFTITTDGEILANNTDEGARPVAAGRALSWPVNVRTKAAPTALIRID
ncbi:hypothetical protein N0B51_12320 [Tsuneonella sp. YG55]|uniref:Lipoprotein n=1 Tax=Tsuneonella litorea TaxID=2976475 RepID=A0A9X2W3W6_9SPHN|nr:hypothetical protein [Tsuneonella litorea]MCT2559764.1 hypothetical protein [Tsuneonella litorea]